ncbi:MAG: LysR substrate-binding domain-containing protein [Burkholderiales bacterium]|nr:LysR substrate-binding domain-containing protein [Burkholderiales bacterium]
MAAAGPQSPRSPGPSPRTVNFQQLRSLRETVRRGLNLTAAAEVLHTSQPALSKQIRELEDELGVQIFVRHGKRYTQLTEAGEKILAAAERVLDEAAALRKVGEQYAAGHGGTLSIAATHTQARYALPSVLARFRAEFPSMQFKLLQGNPGQVAEYVVHGDATFGLATETLDAHPSLDTRAAYSWRHCLIVPPSHPLASHAGPPPLEALAKEPLITYTPQFTGRRGIDAAFAKRGLEPDVVLEAIDSDVIKAYVELGFGVGLIAEIAVDPERDRGLVKLPLGDDFPVHTTRIASRIGMPLLPFERRFVQLMKEFVPASGAGQRA